MTTIIDGYVCEVETYDNDTETAMTAIRRYLDVLGKPCVQRYDRSGRGPWNNAGCSLDPNGESEGWRPSPKAPSAAYVAAARRYLTAEAAERYANGDMSATDEAGHEGIEAEVVSAKRNEE
jgi:hypothetical protein